MIGHTNGWHRRGWLHMCLDAQTALQVKMIVILGELGGKDEYGVVEALKAGSLTKPVVAWVSGTCASLFKSEVQFGHAGARSGGDEGGCLQGFALSNLESSV